MVVKLIEELRQAILIYQVGPVKDDQRGPAESFCIAFATTFYRQPGRAVDCKSPLIVFAVGADGRLVG